MTLCQFLVEFTFVRAVLSGIQPGSTSSEIKKAYHKLAREHQSVTSDLTFYPCCRPSSVWSTCQTKLLTGLFCSPDKNADASHEHFQIIQGAYEILSDPDKRAAYDQYGDDDADAWGPGGAAGMHGGMDDMFASMFGFSGGPMHGMGGHPSSSSSSRPKRKDRGEDQVVDYPVSLEDAYTGKEAELELEKAVVCPQCQG